MTVLHSRICLLIIGGLVFLSFAVPRFNPIDQLVLETRHRMQVPQVKSQQDDFSSIRRLMAPKSECPNKDPLRVYLHPPATKENMIGEHGHFFYDGLVESPCFEISSNLAANVWVIDRHWTKGGCAEINTIMKDRGRFCVNETGGGLCGSNWTIFHVDYSDQFSNRECDESIPRNYSTARGHKVEILYYKRSMVQGRKAHEGKLGNVGKYLQEVNHIPYGVRSDIVRLVNDHISRSSNLTLPISNYETLNPVYLPRIAGVRLFWFHPSNCPINECKQGFGGFRTIVSKALVNISSITAYTIRVDKAGHSGEMGRTSPQIKYVEELCRFQIIVVTQRDQHEDHYRLMEAFAGGGLVMSDPMLLPPNRLIEGEHYVVYHTLEELQKKVLYYLEHDDERLLIAWNGWKLAMEHYRSWNLMEAMLLRKEERI